MVDTQASLAAVGHLMHVLGHIDTYQSSVYLSSPVVQPSLFG